MKILVVMDVDAKQKQWLETAAPEADFCYCPGDGTQAGRALDEAEIVNVAIKKDHQNHGYGAEMVQALIGEEKKNGVVSFILEVRPSNLSAHRCYQKLGFRTIGIRRDFYDCPKENALVMKMESIAGDE